MRIKNFLAAIVMMAVAFTSCQKDKTITSASVAPTPVTPNARLLLSSTGMSGDYSFEYNTDKTVKSYTWGGGNCKAVFIYQANKLVLNIYDNNVKVSEYVYELSNGIAQKMTSTNYAANGTVTDVYVTLYNYNGNGQLVKEIYTKNGVDDGTSDWSFDNNGDLSGFILKDKNGNITWNSSYVYDLSLLDRSVSYGQFNSNGTGSVFPRKAKHLIKQQTVIENNITTTYSFAYTIDAQGYVLTAIVKDNSNAVVDNWTNAWQ